MKQLLIILCLFALPDVMAQSKKNIDSLDIRTSAVCDMCERTIEGELIYEKGIKAVDLDLGTSIIKVAYDPRKTSPEKIRTAVTKLGYYADDLPGDPEAFKNLPDCCQQEGCGGSKDPIHQP